MGMTARFIIEILKNRMVNLFFIFYQVIFMITVNGFSL